MAFEVLGYARKSPSNTSNKGLQTVLQNMINCLICCSLAELVYVSPKSLAKSPIASRDMGNTNEKLLKMELDNCAGNR